MDHQDAHIFKKQNSTVFKRFILIFLIVGVVLAGSMLTLYNIESNDAENSIMFEEKIVLEREKEIITKQLASIFSDLMFLSKHYTLHIPTSNKKNDQLNSEYLAFSTQKQIFDQIRFIDKDGTEMNRVNFNNGHPSIVLKNNLQSKKNRYYFEDTYRLNPGQIFVSPLDLNIENGKVEIPLKPMIRFGTPVVNSKGEKIGIILLNYLAENLKDNIKKINKLANGNIMLVNSNGYWLSHLDKTKEWGFMFKNRSTAKFSNEFPKIWETINEKGSAQVISSIGIFTSVTIHPLSNSIISADGSGKAYGKSHAVIDGKDYYWKLISFIPKKTMLTKTAKFAFNLFWMGAILFILSSVPAFIIAQSFTRKKLYQLSLLRMANYDKLTELPNRKLFLDRLTQTIKISKRNLKIFALLFIDLDGFKSINDTYGHDAGDKLLVEAGKRLTSIIRESDTAARMGGDEFTVILNDVKSLDYAKATALKILHSLNQPFYLNTIKKNIGASIGISIFTEKLDTEDKLLQFADDAMYLAKKEGKNRIKTYEDLN